MTQWKQDPITQNMVSVIRYINMTMKVNKCNMTIINKKRGESQGEGQNSFLPLFAFREERRQNQFITSQLSCRISIPPRLFIRVIGHMG